LDAAARRLPIHNVETERESPFIVMQYVSGESLQARIDRDGPLELCEILRIGKQVADGLSAAHQQGIVHRDIKPSNILLEEGVDRALISDFGLARATDDASLTRTGFHPGTPQYMSPEQASGQSVDARSDLFSLGRMLYTMCTGRPPFRAENSLTVMRRISESEPTPIQEINPNIPEWMCAVITKLMAKSVKDRLSSAAEVRGLLEALLSHVQQPLSSPLPTLPWLIPSKAKPKASESNRRWLNMKTLVLGNSLFIGILALLLFPKNPAPVQQNASNAQGIPVENAGLSQEEKSRLERLIKDNPLVIVGKLEEGKPTGSAHAHVFTTSQIIKGNPLKLNVLLSHMTAGAPDGLLANQNTAVDLPQLNAGEYVLVVEAVEVVSSFAVSSFGLLVTPEKTFNHFIVCDGQQHAAWPLGSPEAAYIRQVLTLVQNEGKDKEVLGHGYSRQGDFIYFDKQRIDQAGNENFDRFAKSNNLKLSQCANVDAASFKALSEEYTKDKNKVYYKYKSIGSDRFWVVDLPQADAKSFEVIGSNFAKDAKNVWLSDVLLTGVDPMTVELVNPGFVWKDAKIVWYQSNAIPGAEAKTFRHLDQAFYRDANRVFWSMTPLEGADLNTFRTFGDDSPYAADRKSVWRADTKITGYDAPTFQAIHQSVIKDKNGVYAGDHLIENADPKSFLKVADLDTSFSALLADEHHYYVFLPYYGDVYRVVSTADSLSVQRPIWEPGIKQKDPVAIATAELGRAGWKSLNIAADSAINTTQLEDREKHVMNIYTAQFIKAWEIIREKKIQNNSVAQTSSEETVAKEEQPAKAKPSSEGWRLDIVAFDTYLSELVGNARVPDKPSLEKRVTIVPGSGETNSEVLPVTDGAGGYIDMAPGEDTVQFQVNKAIKGQKVKWEFLLAHDAKTAFNGVTHLIPKSASNENAKTFLTSIIVTTKDELVFKAGDLVKLEGTIGDASQNKGLGGILAPGGPVAVYHLDSTLHPVFWLGLTDVKISGPTRKTTALIQPDPEVTAFAKDLLRACMLYDEKKLNQLYASEVQLLPGNRLFYFGLEVPSKMTEFGVPVKRDEMLVAIKNQAGVDPIPSAFIGQFIKLYRIEQLDVAVGDYSTEPNQPSESLYRSLRFKIQENDVLLKISVPGVFRYIQLRKAEEQWKVIGEY
jgi:serine/threonine protein kinase